MIRSPLTKSTTALALSTTLVLSAIVPVSTAHAHDRHNRAIHYGNGAHLNQNSHRQFHSTYGQGQRGAANYRGQRHQPPVYYKKNSKGDLIAAGIIGLAVGAIIASEAANRKAPPAPAHDFRRNPPAPYYGSQTAPSPYGSSQHVPLDQYSDPYRGGPEVVTFNDPTNLQPWTPGWRDWCTSNYRSFNQNTGTFRGYDGLDHFCVPK